LKKTNRVVIKETSKKKRIKGNTNRITNE